MNASSSRWHTWLAWLLVGIPGGVLAMAVAAETPPFIVGFARSGNESDTSGYAVGWAVVLAGALTGASLGAVQRLVLRKRLPNLAGWAWASSAGFGLAFTVVWAVGGFQHGNLAHHTVPHAVDLAGPVGGAAISAGFGAFQWLVLRRHVRRAGCWVPANSCGFGRWLDSRSSNACKRLVGAFRKDQQFPHSRFLSRSASQRRSLSS